MRNTKPGLDSFLLRKLARELLPQEDEGMNDIELFRHTLELHNEQLAAKDAEIAELRRRFVECEEAVDQAVALAEYLEGHSKGAMAERVKTALSAKFAQERRHVLANLTRRSMLLIVAERERNEALREAADLRAKLAASESSDAESIAMYRKARDERDEARECIRRLCGALRELRSVQDSCWQTYVDVALAATPEHLRK